MQVVREVRAIVTHGLLSAAIGAASALIGVLAFAVVASAAEPDDPFQYLEDPADARTPTFYAEQDAAARAKLDAIPGRAELLTRIRALRETSSTVSSISPAGNKVFYLRHDPRRGAAVLCMRDSLSSPLLAPRVQQRRYSGTLRERIASGPRSAMRRPVSRWKWTRAIGWAAAIPPFT